jgi:dihydrofolate reductase
MRAIVVNTFLTLDGVMQAPGGPEEDPTGGFTHGGWSVGYWDERMNERMAALMSVPFALLLGRGTYEIFAAHWPYVNDAERSARGGTKPEIDDPVAAALNSARKYVASTTLTSVGWQNSTLLEGDVVTAVRALKAEPGPEIQVHGSAGLLQTLIAHQLVDEYRLYVFPVVLGSGKRLFADGVVPSGLQLVDHDVSTTGVFMATYRPAPTIGYGSFAFEVPTEEEVERRSSRAD